MPAEERRLAYYELEATVRTLVMELYETDGPQAHYAKEMQYELRRLLEEEEKLHQLLEEVFPPRSIRAPCRGGPAATATPRPPPSTEKPPRPGLLFCSTWGFCSTPFPALRINRSATIVRRYVSTSRRCIRAARRDGAPAKARLPSRRLGIVHVSRGRSRSAPRERNGTPPSLPSRLVVLAVAMAAGRTAVARGGRRAVAERRKPTWRTWGLCWGTLLWEATRR